jgi:hypothetical protein
MSEKLNKNNTKTEFMEEYAKQLKIIEELKQQLANPQEIVKSKQITETLTAANNVANSDTASIVNSLKEQISGMLTDLTSKIETGSEQLTSLEDAIQIKKKELQELFDIEVKAYSLSALENTEKTVKHQYEITKKERETELNTIVNELNNEISNLKNLLNDKLNEIDEEIQIEKQKAIKELEYELKRKKQVDNDNWFDEKKQRESELAEKEKEVNLRLEEVEKREEKVEELESKVAEISSLIEEAKKEAYDEGKKKAAIEYGFEKRAIQSQAASEKSIVDNKVEMLEATVNKQSIEIERLNADLKDAYNKIQETAKATVEAQANAKMVTSLEAIARDNKNIK